MAYIKVVLLFLTFLIGTQAILNHFRSPRNAMTQCPPDYKYVRYENVPGKTNSESDGHCVCRGNNEVVLSNTIHGQGNAKTYEFVCPDSLPACPPDYKGVFYYNVPGKTDTATSCHCPSTFGLPLTLKKTTKGPHGAWTYEYVCPNSLDTCTNGQDAEEIIKTRLCNCKGRVKNNKCQSR